jgi:ATP-dependent DNA ligase
LIEAKKAWYVRKRNGEMMVAMKGEDGGWRLYSSKMLPAHKDEVEAGIPWADRLPHIVQDLDKLDIPASSILLGELVADHDHDDLQRVGAVMKSLTPRALELQKDQPLHYCIWDLAFLWGEPVLQTKSYAQRMDASGASLIRAIKNQKLQYLTVPEIFTTENLKDKYQALQYAKTHGWEGWVVVDPDAPGYGDKALSYHGKADRPLMCGKLKPKFEADFIARWDPDNGIGTRGKGKKSLGVGALFLYLWDPQAQQEVYISKCGGGLKDEDVVRLADPSLYPMAVQVEFGSWTPDGSLQFPEYVRDRPDKTPQECTIDQRPALEEE